MKNVVLGTALLATSSLVGCVVLEPGTVTVDLQLVNGGTGALGACQQVPAGGGPGDGIRVNGVSLDGGVNYTEIFDCTDTQLVTTVWDAGDYDIFIDYVYEPGTVANPGDDQVVGSTGTLTTTVDGDLLLEADLTLDKGFFTADLALVDAQANPIECTDVVGQNGISILSTNTSTTAGLETLINCAEGGVFSRAMPIASYTTVYAILNSADESLGDSDPINGSIDNGNEYKDLGAVTIDLD